MKNLIRFVSLLFFLLELILPSMVHASKLPEFTPLMNDKLPAQVKEKIGGKIARTVFMRYRAVKTAKDFENLFLSQLSEKERPAFIAKYFPLKEYPSLTLDKNSLVFKWSQQSLKIEFEEIGFQSVRINGKNWAYSTRVSAAKNAENLENFLNKLNHHAVNPLWKALVPEANAFAFLAPLAAILIPIIVVAIATGAGSIMYDATCAWFKEKQNIDLREKIYSGACADYFKNREAVLKKKLGIFDSFMDIDQAKELKEKYELDSLQCPKVATNTAFTFKAKVRRSETNPESIPAEPLPAGNIISTKGDPFVTGTTAVTVLPSSNGSAGIASAPPVVQSVVPVNSQPSQPSPDVVTALSVPAPAPVDKASLRAWGNVMIKVKASGAPEEIMITPDGVDPSSAEAENNIIFRIKYNEDGSIDKVGLRNNLYQPNDGSSPVLWYGSMDVATRLNETSGATEVDANLTSRLAKSIEMIGYLKERTKECRREVRPTGAKDPDPKSSTDIKSGSPTNAK